MNLGSFSTLWDELLGTSADTLNGQKPITILVCAAHLCYSLAFFAALHLLLSCPVHALSVYVLAYWIVPPQLSAAAFNAVALPEAVRWLLGSVMDRYRRDNAVTWAKPGEPGAFKPSGDAAESAQAEPVYIFGCHPTGA